MILQSERTKKKILLVLWDESLQRRQPKHCINVLSCFVRLSAKHDKTTIGLSVLVISVHYSVCMWFRSVLEKKISSVEHLALSYAGLKLKCCHSRKCTCEQGSNVFNVLLPTIHRSLTDMALELPASRNFQIIGMALATVTLGAPGTRTARLKQSVVKWTEQILKSPLGLKLAQCVRKKAFPFWLSKLFFGLCEEMPKLGFDLLLVLNNAATRRHLYMMKMSEIRKSPFSCEEI